MYCARGGGAVGAGAKSGRFFLGFSSVTFVSTRGFRARYPMPRDSEAATPSEGEQDGVIG